MKIKSTFIVTALIIILGCIYIFGNVADIPFVRCDEGWITQAPYMLATTGRFASPMFRGYYNNENKFTQHLPFYYLFVALSFKFFGYGILQGRLVSLFFCLLVLSFTFLIGKLLIPDKKTYWGLPVLLLLTTPYYFVISRTIRPEIAVAFFVLLSYFLLLQYYKFRKYKSNIVLLFAGLISGLALVSHVPGVFVAAYCLLLIFCYEWECCWTGPFWRQISQRFIDTKKDLGLFLLGFIIPLLLYIAWLGPNVITTWQMHKSLTNSGGVWTNIYTFFLVDVYKVGLYFGALMMIMIIGYLQKKAIFDRDLFWFLLMPLLVFVVMIPVLPHANPIYINCILAFIYLLIFSILARTDNVLIKGIVVALVLINMLGLGIYWKTFHGYDYQAYLKKIQIQIPEGSNILGQVSLFPGFYDTRKYHFYPFQNNYLFPTIRNYEVFKERMREFDIQYIIYDQYSAESFGLIDDVKKYLAENCVLIDQFVEKYYGGEGKSSNNTIMIFKVNNSSLRQK
ncbi:MAG: glycosyltransferase family 39 protein [Candidatus Margulisiibacteriota bacterium]|jgi:hypothetical protein